VHGNDEHRQAGHLGLDLFDEFEAVGLGEGNVQNGKIGLGLANNGQAFCGVGGRAGDREALRTQQARESVADQGVIVNDNDADFAFAVLGRRARFGLVIRELRHAAILSVTRF